MSITTWKWQHLTEKCLRLPHDRPMSTNEFRLISATSESSILVSLFPLSSRSLKKDENVTSLSLQVIIRSCESCAYSRTRDSRNHLFELLNLPKSEVSVKVGGNYGDGVEGVQFGEPAQMSSIVNIATLFLGHLLLVRRLWSPYYPSISTLLAKFVGF